MLATLIVGSSMASATEANTDTAVSEQPNCAARYHERLVSEVGSLAKQTQAVADTMRGLSLPQMPGTWLFWDGTGVLAKNAYQQRLLATPLINREANVMCARQILARGGRIRCMKWKPLPPDYKPSEPKLTVDPTKPKISPAERQFAARLASLVTRQGGFSELDRGTAFYHLLQRTTDELTGYTTQKFRSTICTGGLEMVGFYRRQLSPLTKKAEQSQALMQSTLEAAGAITRALQDQSDDASTPRQLDALLPELAKLSVPKNEQSDAEALQPETATPFALIQQVRDHLSDERLSAMPAARSAMLLKAWRNVEFALYAKHQHKHISKLSQSFAEALAAIETAHQEECTCGS